MTGDRSFRTCIVSVFVAAAGAALAPLTATEVDPQLFEPMAWREVGPYRGGRSAAVAGIRGEPLVYYFGATGGGVWKTTDAGASWENVSDGYFGGSIGAVAVSEWDPNVVYVGGGEKTVRGNVSHGDGMWKSTDAGESWTRVGLEDSRHIPRVRVHPRDPDLVYAAVLGHLFGANEERGVYRSRDGGASWERVLFANENAGAVDLVMDPVNPRVLYASTWRVRRTPYSLESGGEGSGLWKSTDGGDSWKELTRNDGLPEGTVGIIGVTVSPSDNSTVYAIVEAEEGGVFRSTDAGESWERTNEERKLRQRAWYYTRIVADPEDEDTVYVLNVRFHRSKDGGRTFEAIDTPHGDNHDLWIAPEDPLRMIESNDGGANVSFDGGETWSRQDNQPTAQFYRISVDNAFPYRLLGGQQDNSAIRIRHRTRSSGIGPRAWEPTAGGESGHIVAHPENPEVVYGGSYGGFLTRVDHSTEEVRAVDVWPDNPMGWGAAELRYRFQWNFPIFFSPHEASVLYAAGNVLFRSTDQGASWTAISPDLTRDDESRQGPSGGPITKDNTSVEYYCTIFAAAESPLQPGVLWTGSDDGLVHLSTDGGESWSDVTPPDLPEWAQINSVEPHPFDAGGLYLAATRYKLDDFEPYLYRTTDRGASWTRIDAGIARDHFTRVVRADPDRPGLLYAGTERGVYVSRNDGGSWTSLQLDLPVVPITDLEVKEKDLVTATQGRGFWILDDLTVLQQLDALPVEGDFHLFRPRAAWRIEGRSFRAARFQGANPPDGLLVHFWLDEVEEEVPVELAFLGGEGTVIRTFSGEVMPRQEAQDDEEEGEGKRSEGDREEDEEEDAGKLELRIGLNRFAWDLRHEDAVEFEGMILWAGRTEGPRVVPGSYRVRLTVGEEPAEAPFEVLADPRSGATPEELQAQFDFLLEIRDKLTEVHEEIARVREVREQLADLEERLGEGEETAPLREAAASLGERMRQHEEALYQTKNRSRQDPLNFPIRLNNKLAALARTVGIGDNAPTAQAYQVKAELMEAVEGELEGLRSLWEEELPALNQMVRESAVPAIRLEEE